MIIILKWITIEQKGVNWVYLIQNMGKWCDLANTQMNLLVPQKTWLKSDTGTMIPVS
jgi:hypothetical protein